MTKFDFITSADFRASLESDYAELKRSRTSESWKSILVLSGSIIESLLIDYLREGSPSILGKKDPMKLDLSEAISLCRDHNIISQRAADLCSVIRSYRNLIHPGRQIRLKEAPPSPQSAEIAIALVDVIVEEIAAVRKGAFGLTAEQVASKIINDENSISLLPFLIKEVHQSELERLLIDVIPLKHNELISSVLDDFTEEFERLEQGFRLIFDVSPTTLKQTVANQFIQILKNGTGVQVNNYANSFFSPSDIRFLKDKDIPIVKEYYHTRQPAVHDKSSSNKYSELAPFLEKKDVYDWLDPFVRSIVSTKNSEADRSGVKNSLFHVQALLSDELIITFDKRFDTWISFFQSKNEPDKSEILSVLQNDLHMSRELPF